MVYPTNNRGVGVTNKISLYLASDQSMNLREREKICKAFFLKLVPILVIRYALRTAELKQIINNLINVVN